MAMASWNKISYSRRLFLWLVGYSLVLVGCVVFFQYHREKEFKAEELNARLQQINIEILSDIERYGDWKGLSGLPDIEGIRVSVIDSTGHIVYDNTLDTMPAGNHLRREEIMKAIRSGSGYTLRRHSESTGETYFYSARRGADGMVVRTAVPYSVSLHGLLKADYGFLWVIGGVTVLMCTVGYFATRRVGLHVRRLREFAARAERGENIYDLEPFPHDEMGDISNNIVRLYASLQKAISERDREHADALQLQLEKERIKKRLTNNINHELKTPVAAIQVCLETVLDHPGMEEEKRLEFLRRCSTNIERLRRLLADVALITRMDDARQSISTEPVDLSEIIADTSADYVPLAESKGIAISLSLSPGIRLTGNRSLLESVFHNLIHNAISYSGCSEITIAAATRPDGSIHITVSDNGCGLDPVHLPRLFERFYRVDKGRSRAAGGTGLGLSIVKNAVAIHGGSISVANRPGGGLRFDISLPEVS